MYDHREQYLRKAHNEMKEAAKGVEGMSSAQYGAILDAIRAIDEAIDYATDCYDLRLSDLTALRRAHVKLERSINTEPCEHQIEGFREYGIGDYAKDE